MEQIKTQVKMSMRPRVCECGHRKALHAPYVSEYVGQPMYCWGGVAIDNPSACPCRAYQEEVR